MNIDEFCIEDDEFYQIQARYCRKVAGKCPALRYKGSVAYCSRLNPCDTYVGKGFVKIREPGSNEYRLYCKCRFVEKQQNAVRVVDFDKLT